MSEPTDCAHLILLTKFTNLCCYLYAINVSESKYIQEIDVAMEFQYC